MVYKEGSCHREGVACLVSGFFELVKISFREYGL